MKILIEIRGGVVVECYCDRNDLEVTLLDWDNVISGDRTCAVEVTPSDMIPLETRKIIELSYNTQ